MLNHNGNQPDLLELKGCTMEEFTEAYKELAHEPDCLVKASTILPRTCTEGDYRLFDCWIYYDKKPTRVLII